MGRSASPTPSVDSATKIHDYDDEFPDGEGNVFDEEMHCTFYMGTGFVVALPEDDVESQVEETDREIIGTVAEGEIVVVHGLSLS